MTDAELDALVALGEGITPGPWAVVDNRHLDDAFWICHPDEFTSHAAVRAGSLEAEEIGNVEANARAIAAVPNLIAALTTLRKQRDELREEALRWRRGDPPPIPNPRVRPGALPDPRRQALSNMEGE